MARWKGRRAESNNGWDGYGPWPYTILDEDDLAREIVRLSGVRKALGGTVEHLSFQPYGKPNKNQDRVHISQWETTLGNWQVLCIFDGHAGHETVNHTVKHLPPRLEKVLVTAQNERNERLLPAQVSELLKATISTFDDDIARGMTDLIPGGQAALATMSDDEIRAFTVLAGGRVHPNILPCLAGTTVLVALLDPSRQLYVASVGDGHAVLGTRDKDNRASWSTAILSAHHNGGNPAEVERLHKEHVGEADLVKRGRVFGDIAVTRALGDFVFKLPSIYTERVFKTACPGAYILSKVDQFLPRYLSPPYLSNVAEVRHVDLAEVAAGDGVLVLSSDGLTDMCGIHEELSLSVAAKWVGVVAGSERPALGLLREALGGENKERASFYLTVEMDQVWVDDTTIIVATF